MCSVMNEIRKSANKVFNKVFGNVFDGIGRAFLRWGLAWLGGRIELRHILLHLFEDILFLFIAALVIVTYDKNVLFAVRLRFLSESKPLISEFFYHFERVVSLRVLAFHFDSSKV